MEGTTLTIDTLEQKVNKIFIARNVEFCKAMKPFWKSLESSKTVHIGYMQHTSQHSSYDKPDLSITHLSQMLKLAHHAMFVVDAL